MEQTLHRGQFFATPNLITGSRVLAGCLVPLFWYSLPQLVPVLILWAGFSDWLDGWWARRFASHTPLGIVFDPLADKLFVTPVLVMLAVSYGGVMLYTLLLFNLAYDIDNTYRRRREIEAAVAGRYARERKPVTWLSKGKTAVLFLFLALAAVAPWVPELPLSFGATAPLALVVASWWQSRRTTVTAWFSPTA